MAGHFSHLLGPADRSLLVASYQAEDDPAVVATQLSFPPRRPYNENVVRVPPLLPHLVSLSEHPAAEPTGCDVIGVEDLAVTADSDQLYLIQASTGRRWYRGSRTRWRPCLRPAQTEADQPLRALTISELAFAFRLGDAGGEFAPEPLGSDPDGHQDGPVGLQDDPAREFGK